MAEEQFFSMFTDKLKNEVERLPPIALDSSFSQEIYPKYWQRFDGCEEIDYPVIACDGSLGTSQFSGGITFWVARAVAHTYLNNSLRKVKPIVEVKADYRLEGHSFFMKAAELKVLRLAVEEALEEYGEALALYDGSLYLVFLHHRPHIEARREAIESYVNELTALIRLGINKNVRLIGVSKDSDISYLRAHIIVEELRKHGFNSFRHYRSIKRMRERISDDLKVKVKAINREYFKEIALDISDEALVNTLMKESGFTTPLLLAPQTSYVLHESEKEHKRWSESSLRRGSKSLSSLLQKMDELYSLPPIALIYWKPKHCLRTYRLDVPSYQLGVDVKTEDLIVDKFVNEKGIQAMKHLIELLNSLDRKAYGIRPLLDVDEIARLIRRRYTRAYEPVIFEELKSHGFNVEQRKRSMRDYYMRRY